MLRALLAVLMVFGTPLPLLAEDVPRIAPRPLASALNAVQGERWEIARTLAARDGPAASTLIEWYYLSAGRGTPEQVLTFLRDHPDWPGLGSLRKRSEKGMAEDGSIEQILAFYTDYAAQSGTGALSHATALLAKDQLGEAEATLVLAWRSMEMSTEEHNAFLAADAELLAPHHEARLDMTLWRGLSDVELMLPLVSDEKRALAQLRQKLGSRVRMDDDELDAVTEEQRRDPGIAHALFNRYVRGDADKAIDLAISQSRIEGGLGQPDKWAGWRRALARNLMRDGKAQRAYDLASVHQLAEGSSYSDLEWLSGYLALTYLNDPDLALDHFQRFRAAVASPISLGRAGYWIGRALEAMGDGEGAQLAYAQGATYQTSFYGLLAAERANMPSDPTLSGAELFPPFEGSSLAQSDVVQAAILALAAGRPNLAKRFVTHLGATLDRDEIGQLGKALDEMGEVHLQVMLGKAAARRGIVVTTPYYALHPMSDMALPVPAELSLSIARRESEFDPIVVSGAGAEGLMQVMPGTARDVARDLGLDHDPSRVRSDWEYNARLGATYLAQMADKFGGNIIMISAAYNAGPSRPPQWIERFGDPRKRGAMDIVDWIEHIPFRETRNYVMRVAESLVIYRARLGKEPHPVPFSAELTGATIAPGPY